MYSTIWEVPKADEEGWWSTKLLLNFKRENMKPKRAVEIHDRKKYGLQTPIGFLTLEYCPLGLHAIHHEGQEEGLTQQEK